MNKQWAIWWGGEDPDNCAALTTYDEDECYSMHQWFPAMGIARRTVTYGPWEVVESPAAVSGRAADTGPDGGGGDD